MRAIFRDETIYFGAAAGNLLQGPAIVKLPVREVGGGVQVGIGCGIGSAEQTECVSSARILACGFVHSRSVAADERRIISGLAHQTFCQATTRLSRGSKFRSRAWLR